MQRERAAAFAVWITGLPASGKSTVAAALARQLRELGIDVTVLESDVLRKVFSADPGYDEQDREHFYRALAFTGYLLTQHGISVVFDATANRRSYRDRARQWIKRYIEILVECPLDICIQRDPKGIYRKAREGQAKHVPGLQAVYEPPEKPDVVIQGDRDDPEKAARRILDALVNHGFLPKTASHFNVVGVWAGTSAAAILLSMASNLFGGPNDTTGLLLIAILVLLLLGGMSLLAHGIVDLIRDFRKSHHNPLSR